MMNLRTKHILSISGIVLASGSVGYLLGRMHKPKPLPLDLDLNGLPADRIYKIKDTDPHFKDNIKVVLSDNQKYEYFETKSGGWGIRTKVGENPTWSDVPFIPIVSDDNLDNLKGLGPHRVDVKRQDLTQFMKHIKGYSSGHVEEIDGEKHLKGLTFNQCIVDELPEKDEEDEKDDDIENLRTQGETEYASDEPYIVEENEVFTETTSPDDVETLSYYQTDDVLVDSFDEIVYERSKILGAHILDDLRDRKNGDVVYVRSPLTKRDYEIIVYDGAYEIEVLGADEEQYQNAVKFFKLGEE